MADMMSDGMTWFNTTIKANATQQLIYRRDGVTIDLDCVIGGPSQPLFSLLGPQPSGRDLGEQDPANLPQAFSFEAADLDFGNGPVYPDENDEILWEDANGDKGVYRVMEPPGGNIAWTWQDKYRTRFLVFTQLIGTE